MAPDLDQIVASASRAENPQQPQIGYISKAPATAVDGVYVIIPDYDDELTFGPCLWMPRGTHKPAVGARCLVLFSESSEGKEEPHVVAWASAGDDDDGGGLLLFYYDASINSDISGYKTLLTTPSPNPENSISVLCTGTSDVLIDEFATDAGVPGEVELPAGTAFRRFYVATSGGVAVLRYQAFTRSAAGVETLVRDELSPEFSNTSVALNEWLASPPSGGSIAATDRIVNKIYARRVSGPTNITVTTYFGGVTHASHVQTTIQTGNAGPPGPAGAPGSIWRSGTGAPAGALGIVGDWYLNDANGDVYEKTGASTYTLRDNLTGPQGTTGTAGTTGTPGEKWFSQAGAPAGATGAIGDWDLDTTSGDVYEKTGASAWTLRGNIKGPSGAAARVTSLPGSPTDGQEVIYVADATNGILWHLKYNSGSASAYKWEFVGGGALLAAVETSESSGAAAFGDLATVGPSITVPLAGDYEVRFGSMATNSGPQVTIHGLAVGATAATDPFSVRGAGAASIQASSSRLRRLTALAAATALVSKYRVTASTGTWEQRWLEVRPVRVA